MDYDSVLRRRPTPRQCASNAPRATRADYYMPDYALLRISYQVECLAPFVVF